MTLLVADIGNSHTVLGLISDGEVSREWRVQDGRVKEDLSVMRDGAFDNALTRQWSQLVEELVPIEISQLFFFDGENTALQPGPRCTNNWALLAR